MIRESIIGDQDIVAKLYASTKSLDAIDHPNTNAAVKFDKLNKDATAEDCAEFFANVIELATPIVDDLITKHLTDRSKW